MLVPYTYINTVNMLTQSLQIQFHNTIHNYYHLHQSVITVAEQTVMLVIVLAYM